MTTEKQPLYSVAYEKYNRRTGEWVPVMEYLHAEDAGHARVQFCAMNPNRQTCKIVAIGPVIGYHVEDNEGKVLSLD